MPIRTATIIETSDGRLFNVCPHDNGIDHVWIGLPAGQAFQKRFRAQGECQTCSGAQSWVSGHPSGGALRCRRQSRFRSLKVP
jgi:hypothetical protein